MRKITVGKLIEELTKFAKNCEVSLEIKQGNVKVFVDEFGTFEAIRNKNCCLLKFERSDHEVGIKNNQNTEEAN